MEMLLYPFWAGKRPLRPRAIGRLARRARDIEEGEQEGIGWCTV